MKSLSKEFLVGCLVLLTIGLMTIFGWLMGALGPFIPEHRYHILYAFAGGVEVGSPVRVSGVKVGKVEKIEFLTEKKAAPGNGEQSEPTLRLDITVSKKAAVAVRADSQFYVNMAGIIGERYIEISPGTEASPVLAPNATARGIDPPRIDQLLSQGYGVFGRIQDLLEQNEKSFTDFLTQTNKLLTEANHLLKGNDRKKLFSLVDNLNDLTSDLRGVTRHLSEPEQKELFRTVSELLKRAYQIDKPALKKFLQEEGVRARIF